jgi:hypothetical protein
MTDNRETVSKSEAGRRALGIERKESRKSVESKKSVGSPKTKQEKSAASGSRACTIL